MKSHRYFPMITPRAYVGLGLRDDFDRIVDSLLPFSNPSSPFVPPVDIEESAEAFVVRADVPGVQSKDLKVTLLGDTLTIRGERTVSSNGSKPHRTERVHGSFERSFELPTPVRGDQIRATFKDGVLEVHVPKADEARRREIDIQVG